MQENAAKTKKDKTTLLMTEGNIWKLLIVFSIPLCAVIKPVGTTIAALPLSFNE